MPPSHIITAVTFARLDIGDAVGQPTPHLIGGATFTGHVANGAISFALDAAVLSASDAPDALVNWLDLRLHDDNTTIAGFDLRSDARLLEALPLGCWSPAVRVLAGRSRPVIDLDASEDGAPISFQACCARLGVPCATPDPTRLFTAWCTGQSDTIAHMLELDVIATWRLTMLQIAARSSLGANVQRVIDGYLATWLKDADFAAAETHLAALRTSPPPHQLIGSASMTTILNDSFEVLPFTRAATVITIHTAAICPGVTFQPLGRPPIGVALFSVMPHTDGFCFQEQAYALCDDASPDVLVDWLEERLPATGTVLARERDHLAWTLRGASNPSRHPRIAACFHHAPERLCVVPQAALRHVPGLPPVSVPCQCRVGEPCERRLPGLFLPDPIDTEAGLIRPAQATWRRWAEQHASFADPDHPARAALRAFDAHAVIADA